MLDSCEVTNGKCQACGPVENPDCATDCVCACHPTDEGDEG